MNTKGNWSFLHEWVIYEYLMSRFAEKTLRLKCVYKSSNKIRKDQWVKVSYLETIRGTSFPDVKKIHFVGEKDLRPAEVKFTTSLFNYHKSKVHISEFDEFQGSKGCIIVVRHDYLPAGLEQFKNIDIFELDINDFISFSRENFDRLCSPPDFMTVIRQTFASPDGGSILQIRPTIA